MKAYYKRARYYYWLLQGFLKKHFKIILLACAVVFILIFFSSALADTFTVWFSLNKQTVGMVSEAEGGMPLAIVEKISRPIVSFNEKGEFVPNLAERISTNKGGTELLVQLRNGLFWQDGKTFSASSIPKRSITFPRVTTEIINDHSLKFTLPETSGAVNASPATFPALLSSPLVKENFVGIGGEYKLRSTHYTAGKLDNVVLVPQTQDKPLLQYRFYTSSNDLLLAYKLGEVNEYATYERSVVEPVRSWRNTQIQQFPDAKKIMTLFINTQKAPLDNRSIRQAIAQGVDYKALEGQGIRAYTSILPHSWAFNRDVRTYDFEPEIARGILAQNSSKNQRLTLYSSYQLRETTEAIKKSLEQVGFVINVRYTNYIPDKYDLFLAVLEPGIDPDQYIWWHSTQVANNFSKLRNVKVDKLLEDGRKNTSQKERLKAYLKFQEVLADEVPAVFLFHPNLYVVTRK